MTPIEWLEAQLRELGLSKQKASEIMGKSHEWLSGKLRREKLDTWEAIAIATDLSRHVNGKEPKGMYERYRLRKEKKRKAERPKPKRNYIDEWENPYLDWRD